jgi:hypothetical protein
MTRHPFTGGVIIPTACWLCGEELNAPVHVHDTNGTNCRCIACTYPIDREGALRGFCG